MKCSLECHYKTNNGICIARGCAEWDKIPKKIKLITKKDLNSVLEEIRTKPKEKTNNNFFDLDY